MSKCCEDCYYGEWVGDDTYVCENPDSDYFEYEMRSYFCCNCYWADG